MVTGSSVVSWMDGNGTVGVTSLSGGGRRFSFLFCDPEMSWVRMLGRVGTALARSNLEGGEAVTEEPNDCLNGDADGGGARAARPKDVLVGGAVGGCRDALKRGACAVWG